MRKTSHLAPIIGSGIALGAAITLATGAPAAENPPAVRPRPTAFLPCAACHSVEPGRNGIGPSLAGIAGRPAATLRGFDYSPALRNAGLTWNAVTLDTWLTSPQRAVPGTRMPFTGIADPTRRKQVVDYLMSLK